MWAFEQTFYQIYPLGFCGAERTNGSGAAVHRFGKIESHIERLKNLGIGAVLLNPCFQSQSHGYDTTDFYVIDNRLGTNEEFKGLVEKFHESGIRVVLDGVFNHVGRNFAYFQDVLKNRQNSAYKDFFNINFSGNSCYNDGLWYEGWEGHYELVKLNLHNSRVREYVFGAIEHMIRYFDIDGLRLDVCYLLPDFFLREMKEKTTALKKDFFLVGEMIHGDYNRLFNCGVDSATNYECYKGLYSAINSQNLFEIEHSLSRQFADTNWALYKGKHLMTFADNHDVTRSYSVLTEKKNIYNMYAMLFMMPGVPCLYYGSEYALEGVKGKDDAVLRPAMDGIETDKDPRLYDTIQTLIKLRKRRKSLNYGSYLKVTLDNKVMSVLRQCDEEKTLFAVNISSEPLRVKTGFSLGEDLITGEQVALNDFEVPPYAFKFMDVKQNP